MNLLAGMRDHVAAARLLLLSSRKGIGGKYARIYQYHIRKTAGSSLNAAFWGLVGLDFRQLEVHKRVRRDGLAFVRHHRTLIRKGAFFYASSHVAAHVLSPPEGTFTMTVLRDPVDRLLSHYRNLLWVRDDPGGRSSEIYFVKYLEENEMMWLGDSLGDFLDRAPREHILRQLYMFSANYDVEEAAERILACSAVCFTETYNQDLQALAQRLDLPLRAAHERRSPLKITLPAADVARVREILEPEYALLQRVRRGLSRSPL
jgi:hypothetical protein